MIYKIYIGKNNSFIFKSYLEFFDGDFYYNYSVS